jgi:membrane-bound hydrogenase subunit beta
MTPESVLSGLRKELGKKMKNARIDRRPHNMKEKNVVVSIWFDIDRKDLKKAVGHLCEKYPDPHFAVCSGYDLEKSIVMLYHFTLNYGVRAGEMTVNMRLELPKKDPSVETITGLIPGALVSEREMQEMLGVKVKGIPDSRRLFLDPTFPKGVYPWRRDEKGPQELARNVHGGKS